VQRAARSAPTYPWVSFAILSKSTCRVNIIY
jgi:hypothetical protein